MQLADEGRDRPAEGTERKEREEGREEDPAPIELRSPGRGSGGLMVGKRGEDIGQALARVEVHGDRLDGLHPAHTVDVGVRGEAPCQLPGTAALVPLEAHPDTAGKRVSNPW